MDYNQVLKDLRRESLSVKSRLQSIIHDNRYVEKFRQFPIIANERCGLWYVKPEDTTDTVYFKSTDGHTGEWKFSLRRLNLNLLDHLKSSNIVVIVDSTRKGKLMPDALLKTVPIWCAVLNYLMFEDEEPSDAVKTQFPRLADDNWLLTPPEMVSRSEHSSICQTIPVHAEAVKKLGIISKEKILQKLGKRLPLIPLWMYPSKGNQNVISDAESLGDPDFFTVCCLTASVRSSSGSIADWPFNFPYIQGSADDHELWATREDCGADLDHRIFWDQVYAETSEDIRVIDMVSGDIYEWISDLELVRRIAQICSKHEPDPVEEPGLDISQLKETGLYIGLIVQNLRFSQIPDSIKGSNIVTLSEKFKVVDFPPNGPANLAFQIESSKKGAKRLREVLPQVLKYINGEKLDSKVLILCDSGKDLCVAVALSLLCLHFDDSWHRVGEPPTIDKDVIRRHLAAISEIRKVNPSRNTLQSVNSTIM